MGFSSQVYPMVTKLVFPLQNKIKHGLLSPQRNRERLGVGSNNFYNLFLVELEILKRIAQRKYIYTSLLEVSTVSFLILILYVLLDTNTGVGTLISGT